MKTKEISSIILRYCGKEFDHYTYNGNGIHRYFFVDEQYTFYEFFDNGGYTVEAFLSGCKNGTWINVHWKRYGKTWKKIILDCEYAPPKKQLNAKA